MNGLIMHRVHYLTDSEHNAGYKARYTMDSDTAEQSGRMPMFQRTMLLQIQVEEGSSMETMASYNTTQHQNPSMI